MDRSAFITAIKDLQINKSRYSEYGKYYYRSGDDILNALKPALYEHGMEIHFTCIPVQIGTRYYIKATAIVAEITNSDNIIFSIDGYAREPESKTKFDEAQVTGSSMTYAKKSALDCLLALTDDDDPDGKNPEPDGPAKTTNVREKKQVFKHAAPAKTTNAAKPAGKVANVCADCGAQLTPGQAAISSHKFGRPLCGACQAKAG